jgi:hypothetical protein
VQLAVPTFEKSELVNPLMASSKTTAYTRVREFAGELGDEMVAEGLVTSAPAVVKTTRPVDSSVIAGALLPAISVNTPAG